MRSTRPEKVKTDDLYFVRVARFLKIGRSRNVEERLRIISCHAPVPPKLIGSLAGQGRSEKLWHEAFYGIRSHREWFRITPELKTAVDAALRGEDWIATITPADWQNQIAAEAKRMGLA